MTQQTKKKIKVLFLDIDGVLNSTRTAVVNQGYPHDFTKMERFDSVALGLMRRLCKLADLSIVLSSTWRKYFSSKAVGTALDLPVMDATDFDGPTRGHEIARWLDENQDKVGSYVIVDDDSDMLDDQLPHFVQTDGNEGLSWRDYQDLCGKFNVSPFGDISQPNREHISEAAWHVTLQS